MLFACDASGSVGLQQLAALAVGCDSLLNESPNIVGCHRGQGTNQPDLVNEKEQTAQRHTVSLKKWLPGLSVAPFGWPAKKVVAVACPKTHPASYAAHHSPAWATADNDLQHSPQLFSVCFA